MVRPKKNPDSKVFKLSVCIPPDLWAWARKTYGRQTGNSDLFRCVIMDAKLWRSHVATLDRIERPAPPETPEPLPLAPPSEPALVQGPIEPEVNTDHHMLRVPEGPMIDHPELPWIRARAERERDPIPDPPVDPSPQEETAHG